jgi:hypothetical protein
MNRAEIVIDGGHGGTKHYANAADPDENAEKGKYKSGCYSL